MIHAYLANLEDLDRSPHTIRVRKFFLSRFADDLDPATATTPQIRAWIDSHSEWGESSRYAALASIRACYRWAHGEGIITADPAQRIRFHEPADVHRPVVDDLRLQRALRDATPTERAVLRLAAECGLRVHEIVKVRSRDLDGRTLTVVGKGRRTRRLRVSRELAADLSEIEPSDDDYYFEGRHGGHRSTTWAYSLVTRLVESPPHALRRRAAMVLYRASGHDVRLVQTFLGHATLATTMVYLGVELDDLERASQMTSIAA